MRKLHRAKFFGIGLIGGGAALLFAFAAANQGRPPVVQPRTATPLGQAKIPPAQVGAKVQGALTADPNAPRRISVDLDWFELFLKNDHYKVWNGDEPYLFVRLYWIDGTTVKLDQLSTATFREETRYPLQGNLGRKEVREFDAFNIPAKLGHYEADLIPIAPVPGYPNGLPAQVAIAIAACEKDRSSEAGVQGDLRDSFGKFEKEFEGAIRSLTPARASTLADSMAGFFKRRLTALRLTNITGIVDPDDIIATQFLILDVPTIVKTGRNGLQYRFSFDGGGLNGLYRLGATIQLKPPVPINKGVEVTITQVKAVDDLESFGRGKPDFQVRVGIGGKSFDSPEQSGDTIRPNWTFRVPVETAQVPISIELFERDGLSPDEHCDINPRQYHKSLLLRYDVATGQIFGDKVGPGVPEQVSRGSGDSDRAEVAFTVKTFNRTPYRPGGG